MLEIKQLSGILKNRAIPKDSPKRPRCWTMHLVKQKITNGQMPTISVMEGNKGRIRRLIKQPGLGLRWQAQDKNVDRMRDILNGDKKCTSAWPRMDL